MSTPTPTELLAFLQEHGFLTPSQWQQIGGSLAKFADSRALVRELVERKLLTAFQANLLVQGRGKELLFGPYHLLERLGEGGMGQVFKARHIKMDRAAALKIIPKELVSNPLAVSRFYREAQAVAKLSHPNIVTAFDVSSEGQTHYLAMELVNGIDLARLVQQSGPLAVKQACDYIRQAAVGLQHAYENGLVHRDIKPGNLMVARSSSAELPIIKILDFGLSRFESENDRATRLTQLGQIVGTVDYIAPEQSQNARIVDIRADIYSLGCSLYFLLTGSPPFDGASALERISARVFGDVPSARIRRPEVSVALDQVIAKMTARNPTDRYQTPLEVAQALAPFVKHGANPKSSAESSARPVVAKPAVKKPASVDSPPSPTAAGPKQQPGPVNVWESLTEGSAASVEPQQSQVIRTSRSASGRRRTARIKWLIGGGAALGVLLLALVGMWPGGDGHPIRLSLLPESATASKPPLVPVPEPEDDGLIDPKPYLFVRFHDYEGDKFLPKPTMRFGVLVNDPEHPDRPKKLTFHEHGLSNSTVIRLDGQEHLFGGLPGNGHKDIFGLLFGTWIEMKSRLQGETAGRPRDGLASVWSSADRRLLVTQEVEIVPGFLSRRLDTCLVRYILKNQDTRPHEVGIRFMLDTVIGDKDGVPFVVPDALHLCDTEIVFDKPDRIPDFIQALEKDDLRNPGTVACLQFRIGKNIESPGRVLVGGWPNPELQEMGIRLARAQFTGWEVPFISIKERIGNAVLNDSAVTMYWNEQKLVPGKTRVVGFTYGLGNMEARESGGHLLLTVGGRLVPNVNFTLMALVHDPKRDETLTLELPPGIETVGQQMTQIVPAVPPGASRSDSPVTWRLRASANGNYELTVRSSSGVKQKLPVTVRSHEMYD